MSAFLRNVLFTLGLAVIAWLGYSVFFPGEDELLTTADATTSNEAVRDAQVFLVRLQQLQSINLDDSIFNDARFLSLVDLRVEVTPEPVGRVNPFLPVGE